MLRITFYIIIKYITYHTYNILYHEYYFKKTRIS